MQRRRVGASGLEVSRIGLGTMTWGESTPLDTATAQLSAFVEAGGSLVETADGYGDGAAQQVLGEVLAAAVSREQLVIAGRSTLPGGALGDGAARGALLAGLDATLKRIGTDHLDLWQLPGFDASVPLEETLSAVQVAVLAGKVRYAGLVAPRGWQLATVAERARSLGNMMVPASAQVEYSLLTRDVESELLCTTASACWPGPPSGAACSRASTPTAPRRTRGRHRRRWRRTWRPGATSARPGSCRPC